MTDPTCTAGIHGTLYAYRAHRCRCPAARGAKAAEHQRALQRHGPRPQSSQSAAADVDPVAVARACLGDRTIRLTPAERAAAVQRLTAKGRSRAWIAAQLGIHRRTVARHRAQHRTAA